MKHATVYDFDSQTKKTIPLAELSPNMVEARLPDGSVVWVDGTKANIPTMPLHPSFSESRRQILRQLKAVLDEVYPNTLAEWEARFRCDLHVDREIRIWRWIAYQYKRLTAAGEASQARKKDYFQLCLRWTVSREAEAVLTTVDLVEVTRDEAQEVLDSFPLIPSEFFGGFIAEQFPAQPVVDYAAIRSLGEFTVWTAQASVIFAVDWQSGDKFKIVYGLDVLKSIRSSGEPQLIAPVLFAVDFDSDQLEHLLAALQVSKGHYDYEEDPPSDPFGKGKMNEWLF